MAMTRIARVVATEVPHHLAQLPEMFGKRDNFLSRGPAEEEVEEFRCHKQTGRPLGTGSFIARPGTFLGRILLRQKPGQKGPQKKNENLQN